MAFVGSVRRWCAASLCQVGYHSTTRKLAQGIEYHKCLSLVSQSMMRWNAVGRVRARVEELARVHVEAQAKAHAEAQVRVPVEERARLHEAFLRMGAWDSSHVGLLSTTDEALAAAECGRCRPCFVCWAELSRLAIAMQVKCDTCRWECCRSFSSVEARWCTPRLIDRELPYPEEACVGVKCIRARCFAEGKHSGCIVAGMMAVSTDRCTSNPQATDAATGEECGEEELVRCDCASEEAVALVARTAHVGVRDRGMGRRTDHRKGSPIQVVHRSYAI